MISFFNKFMLRSLFIKSLFILVLSLTTQIAMKEIETEDEGKPLTSVSGSNSSKQKLFTNSGKKLKTLNNNSDLQSIHKEEDILEDSFKSVIVKGNKNTQGSTQSLSSIFIGSSKKVETHPIFAYRCATFLFFCPLVFNSLLNFIFEIDNKPSGMFFNFFSFGWRTLPFLKFMTFDIHFNWFLFAVSAYFDFVYFPKYCPDVLDLVSSDKNIIPLFLSSFVFSAVSLCVNFKVDDYFYITVNLSYVLQKIVCWLLSWRLEKDPTSVVSTVCGGCSTYVKRNLKYSDARLFDINNNNVEENNKDNNLFGHENL